jgi:hypothetical protein
MCCMFFVSRNSMRSICKTVPHTQLYTLFCTLHVSCNSVRSKWSSVTHVACFMPCKTLRSDCNDVIIPIFTPRIACFVLRVIPYVQFVMTYRAFSFTHMQRRTLKVSCRTRCSINQDLLQVPLHVLHFKIHSLSFAKSTCRSYHGTHGTSKPHLKLDLVCHRPTVRAV